MGGMYSCVGEEEEEFTLFQSKERLDAPLWATRGIVVKAFAM